MRNIKELLDEASRHYYNGCPILSDETFDALAHSIAYNVVGFSSAENEEAHLYQMYSLQKFYENRNEGEKPPLSGIPVDKVAISPKFDGASMALTYVNGKLIRAMTRGDGVKGKVITQLIKSRPELVPQEIPVLEPTQVIVEVVAPKVVENSRNYAAGSLNLKSLEDFKTRGITTIAHGVQPSLSETYEKDLAILESWGFTTVKAKNLTEIYPTDGIVFRLDNNKEYYDAGFTSNHPKGAYALKEQAEAVETTILDVIWQVGKSGRITPVAILEPVIIEDATVSRATLNNKAFIEALDIRIGDKVGVIRSGSVIPCILYKI